MHTEGFRVDSDGEVHLQVDENELLKSLSISDVLNHFGEDDILDVMDDSDIIKYLENNNYEVKGLEK